MRREILSVVLAVLSLVSVHPAEAQQARKVSRIGYLGLSENPDLDGAFRKGLRERGYVEGQNISVEYRYAGGKVDRLAELAAELVSLKVGVILASGTQSIQAAKRATKMIPIVFPVTPDPVESGFVASLARPGGNITGLSTLNPEVGGKRLELLKEVIPGISRVAVLWNPTNPGSAVTLKETDAAARSLGLKLLPLEVRSSKDFDEAFQAATREHAGAVTVIPDAMLRAQQGRIYDLATKNRLPTVFHSSEFIVAGGLMSYGANLPDLYRRAAVYVDKILKGTKPADLPVEQPMKFELVINLKTANLIGLTVPPNVLARADKVIR